VPTPFIGKIEKDSEGCGVVIADVGDASSMLMPFARRGGRDLKKMLRSIL
jgi:hypothetical protein